MIQNKSIRARGKTVSYSEAYTQKQLEDAQAKLARVELWARQGFRETGSDGLFSILEGK